MFYVTSNSCELLCVYHNVHFSLFTLYHLDKFLSIFSFYCSTPFLFLCSAVILHFAFCILHFQIPAVSIYFCVAKVAKPRGSFDSPPPPPHRHRGCTPGPRHVRQSSRTPLFFRIIGLCDNIICALIDCRAGACSCRNFQFSIFNYQFS